MPSFWVSIADLASTWCHLYHLQKLSKFPGQSSLFAKRRHVLHKNVTSHISNLPAGSRACAFSRRKNPFEALDGEELTPSWWGDHTPSTPQSSALFSRHTLWLTKKAKIIHSSVRNGLWHNPPQTQHVIKACLALLPWLLAPIQLEAPESRGYIP